MLNQLVGIGLRTPHLTQFVNESPDIGWVEVHSENYITCGGVAFDKLLNIRERYPVSLHGIAMSLGSASGIDLEHLAQIKNLIDEINPFMVSEHLSWNSTDKFLPDLIPTPFNKESLDLFTQNINLVQDTLKRQILLENPSTYFEYNESTYSEAEFLNILSQKTGAGILLDVNNIYVSGFNNGWRAEQYIDNIISSAVKEIHLAGHSVKQISDSEMLCIDSHDNKVSNKVWSLYKKAISRFGKTHTLIEWDSDIPELAILLEEAKKASLCLNKLEEISYA